MEERLKTRERCQNMLYGTPSTLINNSPMLSTPVKESPLIQLAK